MARKGAFFAQKILKPEKMTHYTQLQMLSALRQFNRESGGAWKPFGKISKRKAD